MAGVNTHPLIAIAGPTGSGKSELALRLGERFDGEIVNCDSLQVYRGMEIGTAKTPVAERRGIPHHLLDILEPQDVFNAGDYAELARAAVREVSGRGKLPLVVGGTGFYLRAMLDGLAEGPKRDEALRERLMAREGRRPGVLHKILQRLDPKIAERIHSRDVKKVVRAVEICVLEKRPATEVFEKGKCGLEGFKVVKICLNPPRDELRARIGLRTKWMFEAGLVEEVRGLLARGVPPQAKALEAIGYHQALSVIDGKLTEPEAIELTAIATRQYAKRQVTWFRRELEVVWIEQFGESDRALEEATRVVSQFR